MPLGIQEESPPTPDFRELISVMNELAKAQVQSGESIRQATQELAASREQMNSLMTQANEIRSETHATYAAVAGITYNSQKFQMLVLALLGITALASIATWMNTRYLVNNMVMSPEQQLLIELLRERDALRRAAMGAGGLTTT